MAFTLKRPLLWLAIAMAALVLTACGGGSSGGSTSSSGGSGTVGVMLTDAPSDDFDQILANITHIELFGEDGRVTVFNGNETVDLLQLSNVSDLFAVNNSVPAGSYDKIRLTLDSLTLVKVDDSVDPPNTTEFPVHLPGNGKVDLNPRGSFDVTAGSSIVLEVDVDAEKAIHIVERGGKTQYNFRPVVFVNVLEGMNTEKLVRIHGEAANVDAATGSFDLCPTRIVSSMDDDGEKDDFGDDSGGKQRCVHVATAQDTGIFGDKGDPDVFDSVTAGDELTAIGKFARQTDTATASEDGDSESEDDSDDLFEGDFQLNAAVLELGPVGTFSRIAGTTDSQVGSDNRFDMNVAAGQGIATDSPLPVQLQTGTHIFSRAGDELQISDILPGLAANVDGVVTVPDADPTYLKSALVVMDMSAATSTVSGTLQTVDATNGTLTVTTDTGDTMVTVNGDTRYYVIDTSTSQSEELADADAPKTYLDNASDAVTIDVYGTESGGDFTASQVFVYGSVSG
ncbi:MAG: DUF4382 domain-containing protein [Ectothiorhodospiraceae bacterium]|jgi:hypothetical protein